MQQYKIPQNIDVQDKIFGPFTLKQFLYMIVGGVTIYILFSIFGVSNFPVFLISSLPIAIVTLALVFIKINERDFSDFLIYFIQYTLDAKQKKWIKAAKIKKFESMARVSKSEMDKQRKLARMAKRGIAQSQLENLAAILDTKGWRPESLDTDLSGRVVSSVDARAVATFNIERTTDIGELEDVFSDLTGAIEELQTTKQKEGDFEELSQSFKLLTGK